MQQDFNWAIGGEAGDGIDSTGKIFAQALSRAGRHVYTSKDFASRIRGGYTAYKVRTSTERVESVVDRLDVLVALTQRTVEENLDELHDGSVIIYDGERTSMQNFEAPEGTVAVSVPLLRLAEEAGGAIMRNIVALGATCALTDFPLASLDEALEKRFGSKGESIVANNATAAKHGHEHVLEQFSLEGEYPLKTTDEDYVLLNGAEAIGVGAIAAGCRFYSGYPITPATNVFEYLTGRLEQFGGSVVQAEDELAAVTMALGAARTGLRAMTATSGPGIDLMAETFGLVSQTETPLVICNMMRAGPSSGMATKQEQSDLTMMLHGSHGESPRFVLAPTTVSECFHRTVEAFNLAEKYQLPVYLAGDLSLAVTEQTVRPEELDPSDVEIHRGKLIEGDAVGEWTNERDQFTPHAVTEDGISPRVLPGTSGGAHMTTGLEHNELGRRTESTEVRVQQVDKRNRKVQTAMDEEEWSYREFGDPDADVLVVTWGSNEGPLREALGFLDAEGVAVRVLSVPYLFPRPDLRDEFDDAKQVMVVECNASGQFADLLEHDTFTHVTRIRKYNGVRFTADELAERIEANLDSEVAA